MPSFEQAPTDSHEQAQALMQPDRQEAPASNRIETGGEAFTEDQTKLGDKAVEEAGIKEPDSVQSKIDGSARVYSGDSLKEIREAAKRARAGIGLTETTAVAEESVAGTSSESVGKYYNLLVSDEFNGSVDEARMQKSPDQLLGEQRLHADEVDAIIKSIGRPEMN